MTAAACPLCDGAGGEVVFAGGAFRVIRTDEGGFPAFYRVIWNRHVAELSDLTPDERDLCLQAVVAVERALRQHLEPAKINLATLGNMVPHLHWHVIARFAWDSHFPAPVWAAAQRAAPVRETGQVVAKRALLEADMTRQLSTLRARDLAP
jgi:diadenosine tetraphosphate (Ap4A) HIT family hydrolase